MRVEEKKIKVKRVSSMKKSAVGIITFHCCDNYGAMLQAYGLKMYLRRQGIWADLVPYEPFFMVGRNWLIPYAPVGSVYESLKYSCWGLWSHLKMGRDFIRMKTNMKCFREKYLVERKRRKLRRPGRMSKLEYQYYIVGSDQIWNPDITFGLRKAYFGGFKNSHKKKVIAYAASLGGSSLSPKYDNDFSKLLSYIDGISVREREASVYVERCCGKIPAVVLDPVFLLSKESWSGLEVFPENVNYILVYQTEENEEMMAYVRTLSEETGLQVIELRCSYRSGEKAFSVDYTAGPAEFLGYIHNAEYIITNSFHAVAFSIIYEKRFAAFLHSNRGTRIRNILELCDLSDRLYQAGAPLEIDRDIMWKNVKKNLKAEIKYAEDFLRKNLDGMKGRYGT